MEVRALKYRLPDEDYNYCLPDTHRTEKSARSIVGSYLTRCFATFIRVEYSKECATIAIRYRSQLLVFYRA